MLFLTALSLVTTGRRLSPVRFPFGGASAVVFALLVVATALRAEQKLDAGYATQPNNEVRVATRLSDGSILLGGYFTGDAQGRLPAFLARLKPDGTPAGGLEGMPNNSVYAIVQQPDGKILIGGYFSAVGNVGRRCVARLNANGSLDQSFLPALISGGVRALALQPDGKVVLGGSFTKVGNVLRNGLARLNPDGSLDESFVAEIDGNYTADSLMVCALAIAPDGNILVGGQFNSVNGVEMNRLCRLSGRGEVDRTFHPGESAGGGGIYALQPLADGRILVGGSFSAIGGSSTKCLARLHSNGTLDRSFLVPNINNAVFAVAAQSDGSLLIGGAFTVVGTSARSCLARLLPTGGVDAAFTLNVETPARGTTAMVETFCLMQDGGLLAGGNFLKAAGAARSCLLRIEPASPGGSPPPIPPPPPITPPPPPPKPPSITAQPADASINAGESGILSVSVQGDGPFVYQWLRNGAPVDGGTQATLQLPRLRESDAGSYSCRVTGPGGTVVSAAATLTVLSPARLANVAVRASLAAAQSLVVGFVVEGEGRDLLLRAAGPALGRYGLQAEAMPDPRLELYRGSAKFLENDNWPASLAGTFVRAGAFAFDAGSRDAALAASLSGTYTVLAGGTTGGITLVEVYDVGGSEKSRLVNLSASNRVGLGDAVLIVGVSVAGNGPIKVLLRAAGPALGLPPFSLKDTLADPRIELHGTQGVLASNDDWDGSLAPQFDAVRAFQFAPGSRDAALVATLTGGNTYTIQVSGAAGGTGLALVEVYELR